MINVAARYLPKDNMYQISAHLNHFWLLNLNLSAFADIKCAPSLDEVIEDLIFDLGIILAWFRHNSLVANPEKFQVLFPGTKNANI